MILYGHKLHNLLTDTCSGFQALNKFLVSWNFYKHSSYAPDAGFFVIAAVYKCFHKIVTDLQLKWVLFHTEYVIYVLYEVFTETQL